MKTIIIFALLLGLVVSTSAWGGGCGGKSERSVKKITQSDETKTKAG